MTNVSRPIPLRRRAVLLGAVTAVCAACGIAPPDEPTPEPTAELVATWSEAEMDWLSGTAGRPVAPAVLASDADVAAWTEQVGADPEVFEPVLKEVDLSTHVLVLGGYFKCQAYSEIVVDGDVVDFVVQPGDESVMCVWAPHTVDVWSVPLASTGGTVPEIATTQPGDG